MKLFPEYDPLTIERTAAKMLLATMLLVALGALVIGCAPVHAARAARTDDRACKWKPTSYRLGMDSVVTVTDSAYTCAAAVRDNW